MPLSRLIYQDLRRRIVAIAGFGFLIVAAGADGGAIRQIGTIRSDALAESSGIVASGRHENIYWTHNDSKNAPILYAIKSDGTVVRELRVAATHTDWEDISADGEGNLYIANIGNNNAERDCAEVHRIPEPDFADDAKARGKKAKDDRKNTRRAKPEHTWRLRYPDKPFNAESLFIQNDFGYIISKMPLGEKAAIYRFPLDESKNQVTLEKVADLDIHRPVTAAALSRDGKQLAVLSTTALHLYDINGDIAAAAKVQSREIPIPSKKLEAVTYNATGLLMTAESGEIYQLELPAR